MKKLGYGIAAIGTLAIASAVDCKRREDRDQEGGHHHDRFNARAQMRHDWHPHRDRVVIVKHRHGY